MRPVVTLRIVIVVLVGLAACATARVAVGPWQAPLGREHPLVGRVWDVRAARFVTPDAMVRRLTAARFVLLGEKHDNPDNHQVQAVVLRALLASGRRPIVAFEMFTPDDAPAIARSSGRQRRATRRGSAPPSTGSAAAGPTGPTISRSPRPRSTPVCRSWRPTSRPATARALARGQRSALPADSRGALRARPATLGRAPGRADHRDPRGALRPLPGRSGGRHGPGAAGARLGPGRESAGRAPTAPS